jgi:hypothetical protein
MTIHFDAVDTHKSMTALLIPLHDCRGYADVTVFLAQSDKREALSIPIDYLLTRITPDAQMRE